MANGRAKYRESGLIYYVLDATRLELRLKIGWTANLKERLAALNLQTMSRQAPLLLALQGGSIQDERELHGRFADLRIIGEWFRYEGELREHVATLEHPLSFLGDHPALWAFTGGWNSFHNGWATTHVDEDSPGPYLPVTPVEF